MLYLLGLVGKKAFGSVFLNKMFFMDRCSVLKTYHVGLRSISTNGAFGSVFKKMAWWAIFSFFPLGKVEIKKETIRKGNFGVCHHGTGRDGNNCSKFVSHLILENRIIFLI